MVLQMLYNAPIKMKFGIKEHAISSVLRGKFLPDW